MQHKHQFEDFILTKIKETGIKLDYLDPYKNLDLQKQEYFRDTLYRLLMILKRRPKEKFEYTGRVKTVRYTVLEAWLQNFASKVRKLQKKML